VKRFDPTAGRLAPIAPLVPAAGVIPATSKGQATSEQASSDTIGAVIAGGTQDGILAVYNTLLRAIDLTNSDKGTVARAAHEAEPNPHPQYAALAGASFTGPVEVPAGSAAAPSLLTGGAGLYSPSAGALAAGSGGQQAVQITSDRTLIVGPQDTRLLPTALEVAGIAASVQQSSDVAGAGLSMYKARAGLSAVQAGDVIGRLRFLGRSDTGTWSEAVWLQVSATASPSGGNVRGLLRIATRDATGFANRVTLSEDGAVGMGSEATGGMGIRMSKTLVGASFTRGIWSNPAVPVTAGDVTAVEATATFAATGTGHALNRYWAFAANNIGNSAGNTVNQQYGFIANDLTSGTTNNYGFFGNVSAGAGKWNLYMQGSAPNFLSGDVGLGVFPTIARLQISGNVTGGTNRAGISLGGVIQPDVTASYNSLNSFPSLGGGGTLASLTHFSASFNSLGGGSLGEQAGFRAASTMTQATNNYGFVGSLSSGTGRWNLYMNGSAPNFLAGRLGINVDSPTQLLDVDGNTVRVRTSRTPASATAPGDQGDICWDANFLYVCVATNTWRRVAHSTW